MQDVIWSALPMSLACRSTWFPPARIANRQLCYAIRSVEWRREGSLRHLGSVPPADRAPWPFDSRVGLAVRFAAVPGARRLRVGDIISRIYDMPLAILAASSYREARAGHRAHSISRIHHDDEGHPGRKPAARRRPNKKHLFVEFRNRLIKDKDRIIAIHGIARDITEKITLEI